MRRRTSWIARLLLVALSGVLIQPLAAQIVVQDDRGKTIRLPAPAQRLISLAPHVTEWLYTLNAGQLIVGASDYSDYPPAAQKIPRIGDYARVDFERVLALKPDLIIVWASGTSKAAIQRLEEHGLVVYVSEPHDLAAIARHLNNLGKLTGQDATARERVDDFNRQIQDLRRRYAGQAQVSVFYQIAEQPLMTVNKQHIISDIINLCGGSNVFGELAALVPTVSQEAVLAANPQVIIAAARHADEELWATWRRMTTLRAVQHQQLYSIDPDIIHRPTLRIVQGARQMCQALDQARARY